MAKHETTLWALAKANEIVDYEGAAEKRPPDEISLAEIESDRTLLLMAISDALMEAYSMGLAEGIRQQSDLGNTPP
ncbi:hypothetical protein [Devosia sp. 1566]|uniref:hypothetical protein n=1 Tax=Devosia sp. 1566 TaxID=2499144 RepID=UPI000FDA2AA7|nr:hypothetical protein [Devosia sp. 1566]